FNSNQAHATVGLGFGGGALLANAGTGNLVVLDRCLFTTNTSLQEGGAIAHQSGDLTALGCTFFANRANRHGGAYPRSTALNGNPLAISFIGCNIANNVADANSDASGSGGGLFNSASAIPSTLTVSFTRLFANTAAAAPDLCAQGSGAAATAQNNWWGSNAGS